MCSPDGLRAFGGILYCHAYKMIRGSFLNQDFYSGFGRFARG